MSDAGLLCAKIPGWMAPRLTRAKLETISVRIDPTLLEALRKLPIRIRTGEDPKSVTVDRTLTYACSPIIKQRIMKMGAAGSKDCNKEISLGDSGDILIVGEHGIHILERWAKTLTVDGTSSNISSAASPPEQPMQTPAAPTTSSGCSAEYGYWPRVSEV